MLSPPLLRAPAATLCVLALAVAGCGGSSHKAKPATVSGKGKSSKYEGAEATSPKPAPALVLRDSLGKRVDLKQYRGKAVLITFIYVHCPDICPLIVGNLHTAQAQLGARASKVQIVAVSTDPRGDKPPAVKKFLAAHQMTGRMEYLVGSKTVLGNVWRTWGIVSKPDKASPDKVEHSALIYGISASGKITTLYPANFKPAQIVHDAPVLAAE
jgi:protein SCO1/2